MSLASAVMLKAPIRQLRYQNVLRIEMWAQSRQGPDSLRVIPDMAQGAIFKSAVESFFEPPIEARNLHFAIEWFNMHASHNEVRLVSAMTAIENLVNSNLGSADILIQEQKLFDKTTRRTIRAQIKTSVTDWPEDDAADMVAELNEKLVDLNRRSLIRKIYRLAERWSVPLANITKEQLTAVIQARNSIVHRGQYYDDVRHNNDELADLWDHVMIARELVVRFLLTIVAYQGSYISYVGGFHMASFPPIDTNTSDSSHGSWTVSPSEDESNE
jgi:hypothetical protein